MESLKDNKKIKYIWQDKKIAREAISNINHTNINNNINITNYYPSPNQEYVNKGTITFINENSNVQNVMSYPIKTTTHKTNKIKDSSPTPPPLDNKYHQCQSPYMKKILPSSKRQKSEDGNRIVNIYNNSPSFKYLRTNKKIPLKNDYFDDMNKRQLETQNNINNNKPIIKNNYYLDLSGDDINNKYKSNRNYKHYNSINNNKTNIYQDKSNYIYNNSNNNILYNINKSVISCESNGNDTLFNFLEKPYKISVTKNNNLYKISSIEKKNMLAYNFNSPKYVKNPKNLNINNKKEIPFEKKLIHYIILMQSVIRGYLLRIKLVQYLNLYETIKKAVSIIQFIFYNKNRINFYSIINSNINEKISKYYNMYSNITPANNISLEFQKLGLKNNKSQIDILKYKNKYQIKNNEITELQKELNKKKIDLAVAEKKIKELIIENKKVHNINNIIVRDNKQLALKLKNTESHCFDKLKSQNSNFYIMNITSPKKTKINNLLTKIINKKIILARGILYKYFYKFNHKTKFIYIFENNKKNNKTNLIIENNNFILNENIIQNNVINDKKNQTNLEKQKQKLKYIINKKNINSYIYKNIFEKWMMRALIIKNKEFVKEKKKKKKEKFKQRKQKRLYGNCLDKNDKKNEEENDSGDSEDFEIEQKLSNKFNSTKK